MASNCINYFTKTSGLFFFFFFLTVKIQAQDTTVIVFYGMASNTTSRVRNYGELQLLQGKVLNSIEPESVSATGTFSKPFIFIQPNPGYIYFPGYNSNTTTALKINVILKKVISTWSQYLNYELSIPNLSNVIANQYDYYGIIPATPSQPINNELGKLYSNGYQYPSILGIIHILI